MGNPVPFRWITGLPRQAQHEIERNFLELQSQLSVTGSLALYDALIDPALTVSTPATHFYKNLTDLLASETLVSTRLFNAGVVCRPGTAIVETAVCTLNGPLSITAIGYDGHSSGDFGQTSRQEWDLHGFTVSSASSRNMLTVKGLDIKNLSAGSTTTIFTGMTVYLDGCRIQGSDAAGTSRRIQFINNNEVWGVNCILYDLVAPMSAGAYGFFTGSTIWLGTLNTTSAFTVQGISEFVFLAGHISKSTATPLGFSINMAAPGKCIVQAAGIDSLGGPNGGGLEVPVSITGTGDTSFSVNGTHGDNQLGLQFAVSAGAGNTVIDSDNCNALTISGNTNNKARSAHVRMRGGGATSVLDVTGPAIVRAEFSDGSVSGNQAIFRGSSIIAEVRIKGLTNPFLKFVSCTDSVVTAQLTAPAAASQAYTFDAGSARCILVVAGSKVANFSVASTNAGTDCLVIDELGPDGVGAATKDIKIGTVGKGFYIKEGANATMGVATLVTGAVVVNTTKVTANSRILLTVQSLGTVAVPKAIGVTARTAGTSFTITSADATDTSVVAWEIIEPA